MITKEELVGSWRLESWTTGYSDRDDFTYPFGENPQGLLIYSQDGWMSAGLNRGDRGRFSEGVSPRSVPDEALADAYRSYFHYSGRYRVIGGDVVHYVTQSLYPNFPGTEQLRHAELDGSTLVLSGKDQAGEVTRFHSLVWHRVPAEEEHLVIDGD
jgi:hypothetical protein